MTRLFRHADFIGLLLAAGALAVYLATLSRTVTTEDPGEIAAALRTLGVIHPTGYPLFSLLGGLFSRIPFGDTLIWRLNFMGALLSALATFLFFRLFLFLLSESGRALQDSPRAGAASPPRDRAAAAVGTTVLAFSAVYWSEGVALEVYALHLVLLALVTSLFLRALARRAGAGARRAWLLFAFVLGLSFAHHMMTVLLAPAFLYLFFRIHGFGRKSGKLVLAATPPFFAALTLYLYLPLRAAAKPAMNWGDPSTPAAFWNHVTAAQYGSQMFSSWTIAGRKLLQFLADLPADFGYAPLPLALLGLWSLRRAPRLLTATLLIFATGLLYAVNYAFDDPNFNLHAHAMVAAWAAFGARSMLATRGRWTWPARVACAGAALCPLAFNYPLLDKSRDSAVEDYARNVLASMDSGAVFFSDEYERLGGPAFYLQLVEGYRADVAVLDIILLGNPWFYPHMEARFPQLMAASRASVGAYRAEVDRYLAGRPDTTAHNARLAAMFHDIIAKARAAGRPVYVSSGINLAMLERYRLIPSGMVFRLAADGEGLRVSTRDFAYRPLPSPRANRLSERIRVEYAEGYANQGAHLLEGGDTAGAAERFRKALSVYPEFPEVRVLLHGLGSAYRTP